MKRLFALTPEARNDLREILLDIAEDVTHLDAGARVDTWLVS